MKRSKPKTTKDEAPHKILPLEGKTHNQRVYIKQILENDVIICSGPSGSGKSFIAAGLAAQSLHRGDVERIIITRPLVCAGKEIGSLPGDMKDKIAPYLSPMEENLKFFFGRALYGYYYNSGAIEYRPLEVMRGSTFHSSYMILDEAQNCTVDQIKMFITRMGHGSKVLVNGDIKQNDLRGKSGLLYCMSRLTNVNGCSVCRLGYEDIQRNGLLGEILNALERDEHADI
jgi:phosphate starvation-inducible PhoH-like protein